MAKKRATKRKTVDDNKRVSALLAYDTAGILAILRTDGMSLRTIETETGLNRSILSRITYGRDGTASTYRALAKLAIDRGLI